MSTGTDVPLGIAADRPIEKEKLLVASQWQLVRWKFLRHKLAVIGLVVLGMLYFGAVFAEFVSPTDPHEYNSDKKFHPPQRIYFVDAEGKFHVRPFTYEYTETKDPVTLMRTYAPEKSTRYPLGIFVRGTSYELWGTFKSSIHLFGAKGTAWHVFGTDKLGRDTLSRIIYGSRVSLSIGLVGVAVSFVLGIVIGGISGYVGGTTDVVIQRIIEFLRSIPKLPLWMALSIALPPGWSMIKIYFGISIILSLVGWTGLARVVRGKFMSLREEDFVMAARLHGAKERRIIFVHLLPSFFSHIIASLTIQIPNMILGETALSFIGLGLQSPAISWGVLLRQAQAIRVLATSQWLLIPGVFIVITVLCFNFVGDGLRDAADPYSNV